MKNLTIAFLAAASLFTVSACKKKGGGDAGEAMAKMSEFSDSMCKCTDKACADKVQADMTKWSTDMAAKGGKKEEKPDEATMKKMTEVGQKYAECMTKAMSAGATGDMTGSAAAGSDTAAGSAAAAGSGDTAAAGSAAPAAGGGDLPQECKDYQAAIEGLAKCDKLPQATRDALKTSYDQQAAAWASVPAEGRATLATSCKTAADAVKQSTAACN
jgi:hypothetical protein